MPLGEKMAEGQMRGISGEVEDPHLEQWPKARWG
jgi:hypothetical protein